MRGTMSGKGFIKTFVFKIFCGNFGVSPSKCPSPENNALFYICYKICIFKNNINFAVS